MRPRGPGNPLKSEAAAFRLLLWVVCVAAVIVAAVLLARGLR